MSVVGGARIFFILLVPEVSAAEPKAGEACRSIEQLMRVFVSHSVADVELATAFVKLLQNGTGLRQPQIFFSSRRGDIQNGTFFVDQILLHLSKANLIVALVSRSYVQSHFCQSEVGAALVRQRQRKARFNSFVIP